MANKPEVSWWFCWALLHYAVKRKLNWTCQLGVECQNHVIVLWVQGLGASFPIPDPALKPWLSKAFYGGRQGPNKIQLQTGAMKNTDAEQKTHAHVASCSTCALLAPQSPCVGDVFLCAVFTKGTWANRMNKLWSCQNLNTTWMH